MTAPGESITAAEPRDASTVILVRNRAAGGIEAFLMRRHRNQSFMGGAYVFPGGRLDTADMDPRLSEFVHGFSPRAARTVMGEPQLSEEKTRGLYMAAVRETFEEAGVLLARGPDGGFLALDGPDLKSRFDEYRRGLLRGEADLVRAASAEGFRFALDALRPYARWITPVIENKRFDTRFFVARAPESQKPDHIAVEMTDSVWLSPEEALSRHREGRLKLMPPTLKTLHELTGLTDVDQVFALASRRDKSPVLPEPYIDGERIGLKLTHDPEYSLDQYRTPPRPDEPSRVVLTDGRWELAGGVTD